jgi:NADH:ubiquinone oxidoreductase subunit 5 (subunit L)/multisubunit Na+/H+ antiporter MnhA subunit
LSALAVRLADFIWLVPALPLAAAALTGARVLLGRARGDAAEPLTARLGELAALAGLALLLGIDALAIAGDAPGHRVLAVWLPAAEWEGTLSFMLDGLALATATMTALVGWLAMRFSAAYLHREPGFHRFFIVLGVFLAGIQLVFLSGNGLLAFVGWEMCGAASFLLIAYAWQRPVAGANALFAFAANRIGDAGFLVGLGFAAAWLGSLEWPAIAGGSVIPTVTARLLAIGFVVAALAKSAQLPFTPWIARALEGPTPSSAIFYGSIMVHAGVFLLIRLSPLLAQVPDIMAGIVVAGVATALYAWLVGLVQTDVKSALVFATVFQVGLMFVEVGLGWTTLATIHLCLHAAWRAWQFLSAPSWLILTEGPPKPAPSWLRRHQWLYTAALQRFWLDRMAFALLATPTAGFAKDVRGLESHFVDRALGEPGRGDALVAERPLVSGDGVAGRALAHAAESLQRLELRLSLRGRGGASERLLRRAGQWLGVLEEMLEQPRYLMMAVMATFVVIL